jgi:ATP-dependent protease ClpP protease subunit
MGKTIETQEDLALQLTRMDIQKREIEIRKITAEAERHEMEAHRARKEIQAWEASADEHRIYHFFGGVDASNAISCMDVVGNWARRTEEGDFTIVFNSPGGSVIHGFALYDFLLGLRKQGHHITTVARGMAASMGGILLQAGDKRLVGDNAHMLIHEVSSLGIGKVSELEDEVKFMKGLQNRALAILAERSTLTKKQIENRWRRKDWWLDSEETVKLGFADEIG